MGNQCAERYAGPHLTPKAPVQGCTGLVFHMVVPLWVKIGGNERPASRLAKPGIVNDIVSDLSWWNSDENGRGVFKGIPRSALPACDSTPVCGTL